MARRVACLPLRPDPERSEGSWCLAFALGAVAVTILLAGYLGPVTDQEAGVAGEFVVSLRNDLHHELFGNEFAARYARAVEPVSLIQLKDDTSRIGSIR